MNQPCADHSKQKQTRQEDIMTICELKSPVYGADGTLVAEGYGIGRGSKYVGTILREHDAAHIVHCVNAHAALVEALRQIAKGEGRFSPDPLEHAANTVDDMKYLAQQALALAEQGAA